MKTESGRDKMLTLVGKMWNLRWTAALMGSGCFEQNLFLCQPSTFLQRLLARRRNRMIINGLWHPPLHFQFIAMEHAARLLRGAEDRQRPSEERIKFETNGGYELKE